MFENQTEILIKQRMLAKIPSEINKAEGSFIYDSISPVSIELAQSYMQLDNVAGKINISNLTGEELNQRIYEKSGLQRKAATKATGFLEVIGTGTIDENDIFQSESGIQFTAIERVNINEFGTVKIEAVEAGASGNVPASQIKIIPVSIPGIVSVNNLEPLVNGYDAESDEELLKRYYEKIQSPVTSGNKHHYKTWAKEVTGVGDAKVYPLWNGDNTVKIVIIDSNKQPANPELVQRVQDYIDPDSSGLGDGTAPIGAYCTVNSAVAKIINVSFIAQKDDNFTDEQRKENIDSALNKYFKEIAFTEENIISYNKIGALILYTPGFKNYSQLTINGDIEDIQLAEEKIPVLATGGVDIEY